MEQGLANLIKIYSTGSQQEYFLGGKSEVNTKEYINKIFKGDALSILKKLPIEIVNVGVTSPPYNKGENK